VKPATRQIVTIAGLGLFALVVAAAGFMLVIKPQQTKISSTNAKIVAAQTQLASLRQGPAKAPAIRASDLFSLTRAMPEIDDMPGVVVDLSQMAKSAKLQLVGIRPASRVALADGSSAVPMTVTMNGNWKGLTAFLKSMRRRVSLVAGKPVVGGRIYNVDNVQITSGTKPFELQAVLTMNAFDYGAPPSPTATAGVTGASGATGATTTTTTASGSTAAPATGSGG
jgi:Tfp pilus assembly protein PilO